MKKIALLLLVLTSTAYADEWVNGYTKQDGTYVAGHYRSSPDNNTYNNYTTQGNSNPYTGQQGTRDPYKVQQQYTPPQQPAYQPQPTLAPYQPYRQRGDQRGDSYQR